MLSRAARKRGLTLAYMPTFQIVTDALSADARLQLARQITRAAGEVGQPMHDVTVVFVKPQAVYIHGGEDVSPTEFARVDVTIGGLTDPQRRSLARAVCGLLCDAGVREEAMTLLFHDTVGRQVAVGRGVFPFWPEQ